MEVFTMKKIRSLSALILCLLMLLSLAGCGESRALKEAESLIDAIGEVTVESGESIIAAEEAYARLSDKEKEALKNADILTTAREKLDVLLTEDLIEAIGEVTAESEAAVKAAEKAFADLTEQAKERVSNASDLKEAREALDHELMKKAMLGVWNAETDAIDEIVESVDSYLGGYDISYADYMDSFPLAITLELREDGTYKVSGDKASFDKVFESLRESTARYYDDLLLLALASGLEEYGYGTFKTWEEIENFTRQTKEETINSALGMSIPELVDTIFGDEMYDSMMDSLSLEGRYSIEGNELHLSDSPDSEPVSAEYQTFEFDGDVLTLTGYEGAQFLIDFPYPVEFHRQG